MVLNIYFHVRSKAVKSAGAATQTGLFYTVSPTEPKGFLGVVLVFEGRNRRRTKEWPTNDTNVNPLLMATVESIGLRRTFLSALGFSEHMIVSVNGRQTLKLRHVTVVKGGGPRALTHCKSSEPATTLNLTNVVFGIFSSFGSFVRTCTGKKNCLMLGLHRGTLRLESYFYGSQQSALVLDFRMFWAVRKCSMKLTIHPQFSEFQLNVLLRGN